MNKQLIITLFSIGMLLAYLSYSQPNNLSDIVLEEHPIMLPSLDSTIVPKQTKSDQKNHLKGVSSSHSRYKNLAKEKERRKKIRAQYKKDQRLKK